MNILMLCHPYPNYVPDLLLQGLRKLFGDIAVDYPRKDVLYQGLCGQPNLDPIPGLMPGDAKVDRTDIATKAKAGFFGIVLCDVRAFGDNYPLLQQNTCPLAIIDGEDKPISIKPGPYAILRRETDGSDFSIPLPMALPTEVIDWIDRYADVPKTHSVGFLGSRTNIDRVGLLDEVARRFPDALLQSWQSSGDLRGRDDYYRQIQGCRVTLTFPGVGYDTFRFWENAACNAAHISKRMPIYIPDDFREGREIARFSDVTELAQAIEKIGNNDSEWKEYAAQSRAWLRAHHTTEHRARQTIDRLRTAFGIAS